ncbi:hypothetical protein ACE193_23595 [Bernardetia sp. OM2101]|uniref:hypothetical protein n=1 Tax=Bernardetia sp. OM2101 TaxID=3344876 RepID=UPI0035CEEB12
MHTREERIDYQYQKLAYHFKRLLGYGETNETILQKMLMSQTSIVPIEKSEKEEEKPIIELKGYLKYVKEWNKLEHQSMFVKNGEEQSSIQLFFPLGDDELDNQNYLIRLQNMEVQKIKVDIKAFQTGFTKTDKPKMEVLSISSCAMNSLKI